MSLDPELSGPEGSRCRPGGLHYNPAEMQFRRRFGAQAAFAGSRSAVAIVGIAWVLLVGCVSIRTVGAGNAQDLAAEERYKVVYATQMAEVSKSIVLFNPGPENLGVCSIGGTKQGCYDADVKVIASWQAMLSALAEVPVPPRYVAGDSLLRAAIGDVIQGLELRNKGLSGPNGDDAAFAEHKVVLARGIDGLTTAYRAYPSDNAPQPAP
jgi:hypothetical protein